MVKHIERHHVHGCHLFHGAMDLDSQTMSWRQVRREQEHHTGSKARIDR